MEISVTNTYCVIVINCWSRDGMTNVHNGGIYVKQFGNLKENAILFQIGCPGKGWDELTGVHFLATA